MGKPVSQLLEAFRALRIGAGTTKRGGITPNAPAPARAAPPPTSDVIPTTDIPVLGPREYPQTNLPGHPITLQSKQEAVAKRIGHEGRGPGPATLSRFGGGDIRTPLDDSFLSKKLIEGEFDKDGNELVPSLDTMRERLFGQVPDHELDEAALEAIQEIRAEVFGSRPSFAGTHVNYRAQQGAGDPLHPAFKPKRGRGNVAGEFDEYPEEFFQAHHKNLTEDLDALTDLGEEALPARPATQAGVQAKAAKEREALGQPERVVDIRRGGEDSEHVGGADLVHRQRTAQPESSFANVADVEALSNLPRFSAEEDAIVAKIVRELKEDPFYQTLSPEDQRTLVEQVLLPREFDMNLADKKLIPQTFETLTALESPLKQVISKSYKPGETPSLPTDLKRTGQTFQQTKAAQAVADKEQAGRSLKAMKSDVPNLQGRTTSLKEQLTVEAKRARKGVGHPHRVTENVQRVKDRLHSTGARPGGAIHKEKQKRARELRRRIASIERTNRKTNGPQRSTARLKRELQSLQEPVLDRSKRKRVSTEITQIPTAKMRVKARTREKPRKKPAIKSTSGFDPANLLQGRDPEEALDEVVRLLQAQGKTDFRPPQAGPGNFTNKGRESVAKSASKQPTKRSGIFEDILDNARNRKLALFEYLLGPNNPTVIEMTKRRQGVR